MRKILHEQDWQQRCSTLNRINKIEQTVYKVIDG